MFAFVPLRKKENSFCVNAKERERYFDRSYIPKILILLFLCFSIKILYNAKKMNNDNKDE